MSNEKNKIKNMVMSGLFAALIFVTTAYLFHIPTGVNDGYIHLGDAFIYLSAALMPMPYAMAAASIGAGLADLLSAPIWVIPTIIIKPILVLYFTSKSVNILSKRNIIAVFLAGITGLVLYAVAGGIIAGNIYSRIVTLPIDSLQPIGSGIVFTVMAYFFDKINMKEKFKKYI
jgi:uncharacterized repeat protein (TIGR04002 family)